MNNNIKNLINQVGTDISGKWISIDNSEKLAKLIVKECMDVVARKCASPTAYNALVEHFRVEE